MTAELPSRPNPENIHDLDQSSTIKVSEKDIGIPNPETDTHRIPHTERDLQMLETVENIVVKLQERYDTRIKGWNRNILVEMAMIHTDRRNGFTAATIQLLLDRLEKKKIRIKGKMIGYHNLRKRIKSMYKKGIIKLLSDRDGHGYQYVLANMQDLNAEKEDKKTISSNTLDAVDDVSIEEMLYQVIECREGKKDDDAINTVNNRPEAEFHHVELSTQLISPPEYYEKIKANQNWTMPSAQNRGLRYEGRISRHRTFTLMAYPCGSVVIMIKCTKDPFRWYPREDWIVLYDKLSI